MNVLAILKDIVKSTPFLDKVWGIVSKIIFKIDPKILANWVYKSRFKKNINWNDPQDLIEKIYWLQMYSDTSLWTLCADKYRVREYVKEKIGGTYLNKLYGKWENVDDINWDTLPNSFVLKWNNGSGQVLLVKDKSKLDIESTKKVLRSWLRSSYGYEGAQMHYIKIKSCIIAEEYLVNPIEQEKSLVDYKLWCFHGKPCFFLVAYDRKGSDYKLSAYDLEWNNISDKVFNKGSKHYCGESLKKPESLDLMIDLATKLSQDFIEVRVDFYDVIGKPIFGELTFTSGFGSYSLDFYRELGSLIDLTKAKKNSKINAGI